MNRRTFLTLGATTLGLLVGSNFSTALSPVGMASAETADIQDMVLGDADAPVTVIEYASFTCPHCATFHDNVMPKLKSEYIDTGKVKFVYREVYFDRPGLWAAMVARCGGDVRYFGISDMLFDKQREWIGDGEPGGIAQNLRKIGKSAGLTDADLDACFADGDKAQAMISHYEDVMKEYDITGTPSIVVNGTLHGNMSYEDLSEIIDAALTN
ncbi:DsbA family protein [Actibacterium lipolyticum]|uniref:Disulfide bond formation protein D n=1 Tax=Actibacterium lipolyticum TaxID=1524263 RepID=A0A238KUU9_9RHOB|nr:DsbA family protein [Actibacterium lipolyticum]SMX46381.1 Disulfide bond formation protein D precursor [Actibacterium lipolyticum]